MRYIITILFVLVGMHADAQKLRFSYPGNHWKAKGSTGTLIKYCWFDASYDYTNDTTIGGTTYKQLIRTIDYHKFDSTLLCAGVDGATTYLIREDSAARIVYCRSFSDTSEHVLYNYNLGVGDTLRYSYRTDTVVGIDSILINGIWHKVQYFKPTIYLGSTYPDYVVVEGLGCTNSPLYHTYMQASIWGYSEKLICYARDVNYPAINAPRSNGFGDNDTFTNSSGCVILSVNNTPTTQPTITISPNPATDNINITTSVNNATASIYNTTGACIFTSGIAPSTTINTTQWPTGLYIVIIQNETGILKREKMLITH